MRQILQFGADDMKRCYQCGTCSVVCPQTPDLQAFPRKEMVWAREDNFTGAAQSD